MALEYKTIGDLRKAINECPTYRDDEPIKLIVGEYIYLVDVIDDVDISLWAMMKSWFNSR